MVRVRRRLGRGERRDENVRAEERKRDVERMREDMRGRYWRLGNGWEGVESVIFRLNLIRVVLWSTPFPHPFWLSAGTTTLCYKRDQRG